MADRILAYPTFTSEGAELAAALAEAERQFRGAVSVPPEMIRPVEMEDEQLQRIRRQLREERAVDLARPGLAGELSRCVRQAGRAMWNASRIRRADNPNPIMCPISRRERKWFRAAERWETRGAAVCRRRDTYLHVVVMRGSA